MFVVCVLCSFVIASIVRVLAPYVAFPTYGAHPHHVAVRSVPLTGGPTPIRDCYGVGSSALTGPCPVIVQFHSADANVTVLCAKGVLYHPKCPKALHGIKVYRDLCVQ